MLFVDKTIVLSLKLCYTQTGTSSFQGSIHLEETSSWPILGNSLVCSSNLVVKFFCIFYLCSFVPACSFYKDSKQQAG